MLLAAIDVQAQKIDERLTSLLPSANDMQRARDAREGLQIDTAAVMQQINVRFNSDCTVKSFSAFAMLKEGADCPSALLQKLGVEIREKIGRMLILNIPAESLLDIGDIDEIESVSADQMTHIMNNQAGRRAGFRRLLRWRGLWRTACLRPIPARGLSWASLTKASTSITLPSAMPTALRV